MAYVECVQYAAQNGGHGDLLSTELVPRLLHADGDAAVERLLYTHASDRLRAMSARAEMEKPLGAFWDALTPQLEASVAVCVPGSVSHLCSQSCMYTGCFAQAWR